MTPKVPSKDIKEYFEVEINRIRPNGELTFDLHIYFSRNDHVITWKRKGDFPTSEQLQKYELGGLRVFWVHRSERDAYLRYQNPEAAAQARPVSIAEIPAAQLAPKAPEVQIQPLKETPVPALPDSIKDLDEESPLGAAADLFADKAIKDPLYVNYDSKRLTDAFVSNASEAEKEEIVSGVAKELLAETGAAADPEKQRQADAKMRATVKDVLERVASHNQSVAAEIWSLSNGEAGLDHGVNVGTYATLLAMAFGRVDPDLLGDIALAGLLHDVGVSALRMDEIPERMNEAATVASCGYTKHVENSVRLIESSPLAERSERCARVVELIRQHHEKFDGSGYPSGAQGFKVDDVAQLLGMADLLEELSSGEWDGTKRSRREALEEIERIEKTRTFPQFFNPELLSAVLRWLRSEDIETASLEAEATTEDKMKNILRTG